MCLEHAPFPKVIRCAKAGLTQLDSLEHAPFPKVIRYWAACRLREISLEHAPFPKVIRYVRTEKFAPPNPKIERG